MSYRIIQEGRESMRERGGDPMKMKKYISGIRSMLQEMEECLDEMGGSYGERGDYGDRGDYSERGDYRYGERGDMMERRGGYRRY